VISRRQPDAFKPIVDQFPAEHRLFIHSLPVFIDEDDLFVVHGKWPPNQKATPREILGRDTPAARLRHEILWGRFTDADLHRRKAWPKSGFFGHTPVPTYHGHASDFMPIIAAKMVLLDTAAALSASGRLTAMCADNAEILQADPTGKLVDVPKTVPSA
jgi:hypothetical protein